MVFGRTKKVKEKSVVDVLYNAFRVIGNEKAIEDRKLEYAKALNKEIKTLHQHLKLLLQIHLNKHKTALYSPVDLKNNSRNALEKMIKITEEDIDISKKELKETRLLVKRVKTSLRLLTSREKSRGYDERLKTLLERIEKSEALRERHLYGLEKQTFVELKKIKAIVEEIIKLVINKVYKKAVVELGKLETLLNDLEGDEIKTEETLNNLIYFHKKIYYYANQLKDREVLKSEGVESNKKLAKNIEIISNDFEAIRSLVQKSQAEFIATDKSIPEHNKKNITRLSTHINKLKEEIEAHIHGKLTQKSNKLGNVNDKKLLWKLENHLNKISENTTVNNMKIITNTFNLIENPDYLKDKPLEKRLEFIQAVIKKLEKIKTKFVPLFKTPTLKIYTPKLEEIKTSKWKREFGVLYDQIMSDYEAHELFLNKMQSDEKTWIQINNISDTLDKNNNRIIGAPGETSKVTRKNALIAMDAVILHGENQVTEFKFPYNYSKPVLKDLKEIEEVAERTRKRDALYPEFNKILRELLVIGKLIVSIKAASKWMTPERAEKIEYRFNQLLVKSVLLRTIRQQLSHGEQTQNIKEIIKRIKKLELQLKYVEDIINKPKRTK